MNTPNFTHVCDRCGRPLEEAELRYIAKIQVYAAPGLLKFSEDDLATDKKPEIDKLMNQCADKSEEELMQDVFVEFKFDLCRRCQQTYITCPISPIDS